MSGITVDVNGDPWPNAPVNEGDELSYDQVVQRAFPGAGPADLYRVRYTHAVGDGGAFVNGSLGRGQSIKVRDGETKFTISDPAGT